MSKDTGLDVLLQLLREGTFALSEEMVRECYRIEKQYQHDKDREVPLNNLRRLVEAEAARQISENQAAEGVA